MAPESFLVDAQGVVRYKRIGMFTPELIASELMPQLKALGQPSDGEMKRFIVRSPLRLMCSPRRSRIAIDPLPFKDRAEEVRFQNLTRELRCLVCQNQNLADSEAELAVELRRQVFDMMQSGKSDAEIKQYLVARYNDFVLYDPPVKAGTCCCGSCPACSC